MRVDIAFFLFFGGFWRTGLVFLWETVVECGGKVRKYEN